MTLFRHFANAVESPFDGLLLSPPRKAYQPNGSNQRWFILFQTNSIGKHDGQRR